MFVLNCVSLKVFFVCGLQWSVVRNFSRALSGDELVSLAVLAHALTQVANRKKEIILFV